MTPVDVTDLRASVIVSTYAPSRLAYAVRAIDSVRHQDHRNVEITLVVDQDPSLIDEAYRQVTPPTRIAVNPNPGMANARNFGFAQASGDVVVFLDDDAVAEPGWLRRIMSHYLNDAIVSVGGRSIPEWEGTPPWWLPEELYWVLGCTYRGYPSEGGDVRNVLGNNMSYRASVLRALGGFKLGRARYWQIASGTAEETEFCLRIGQLFPNGRIVYEPNAVVRHWVPESRLRFGYLWRRAVGEGVAKARLRRLYASSPEVLSHEWRYLRHLLFGLVPQTLRSCGPRRPYIAAAQFIVALLVIAATGAGFTRTLLGDAFRAT